MTLTSIAFLEFLSTDPPEIILRWKMSEFVLSLARVSEHIRWLANDQKYLYNYFSLRKEREERAFMSPLSYKYLRNVKLKIKLDQTYLKELQLSHEHFSFLIKKTAVEGQTWHRNY